METTSDIIVMGKVGLVTMGFQPRREEAWHLALLLVVGSAAMVVVLSGVIHDGSPDDRAPTNEAVNVVLNVPEITEREVRTVDEFRMLGRRLNRMIIGLKGMVGNVSTAGKCRVGLGRGRRYLQNKRLKPVSPVGG
jgi:hypothetical protein